MFQQPGPPSERQIEARWPISAPRTWAPQPVSEAVRRAEGLDGVDIDDVIMGCAMPEGPQGLNMGRIISLRAGLPEEVTAQTVNRFCSSGLQTIALAAQQVMSGMGDVVVAGGTGVDVRRPDERIPFSSQPVDGREPSRGLHRYGDWTAENVARKYNISREQADAFAAGSHEKALAAVGSGRFDEEIVPLEVERVSFSSNGGGSGSQVGNLDLQGRRGAAGRVYAGGSGQAETGVSCQGPSDRRQQLSNVGRSGGPWW